MRYYSSSADFYYETSASTLNYYITVNGEAIYNGKAVKSPDRDKISVNIGKRVRDYIRIGMPDFRDYDGVIVPHPEAMLIFNLFNLDSGELLDQYEVKIDETKEWEGEEGCMSEPINGHADPRQKIFYGYSSNISGDTPTPPTPPYPYESEYLTFDIISGGTLSCLSQVRTTDFLYSFDGGSVWEQFDLSDWVAVLNVNAGDKVMFKYGGEPAPVYADIFFSGSTAYFNLEGNIQSLRYGDDFESVDDSGTFAGIFAGTNVVSAENLCLDATSLRECCYQNMFSECSSLVTPPKLPATSLSNLCYDNMFGGCTSLTTAPELPATTLAEGCYSDMFNGCTNLTTPPELPATSLTMYCYDSMFEGCVSLTKAPELPAITAAYGCYYHMFQGCTSLVTPPELPATSLAVDCYRSMFEGCTGLTTAPELPATTLVTSCYERMFYNCTSVTTSPTLPAPILVLHCYRRMFYGCSSLSTIKCLAVQYGSGDGYTTEWVYGVSPTGTFYKDASGSWARGDNGIPDGWTVQFV